MIFKTKTIQAAIFDMDGTMFDTERLRFKTIKQASQQLFGEAISDEILLGSLGLSAKMAEQLAKSQYGEHYPYTAIRQLADELELSYIRKYGVPVKAGLTDILERLKKNGLLLAVATSSRRAIAEEYLINANVLKYFDITVCGDEVKKGKPHPEIFLTAASELNAAPENCLMFEDSENGLLSASDAGGVAILIKDIKDPRPEVKQRAYQAYDSMPDCLDDLIKFTANVTKPKLTEPFPQTFNHFNVGIHGFGAIGGGYLTQIFSHWDGYTRPAKIIAASNNATLRELINAFGKYTVHYSNLAFDQTIEHIHLIDSADESAMLKMYTESDLIGLSLPESAIKQQALIIAKGLLTRSSFHNRELTILVILNKIAGAAFVRKQVKKALLNLTDAAQTELILSKTSFTETVVNRIVSKIPKEILLKQLRINFASFEQEVHHKNLDLSSLLSPPFSKKPASSKPQSSLSIQTIANRLYHSAQLVTSLTNLRITLFNSGPDMLLYTGKGGKILERLRQVHIVDDITEIQLIKNKLLNGTHAILAWYASLLGYQTIAQGMGDERVLTLVRYLVRYEIKPAMLRENPALSDYINTFINNFIQRCKASFKDPCQRVGRDPLRKLQRGERILGSIDLAQKHNIATPLLEFGTACGIFYAISLLNPDDKECQLIKTLYDKNNSVRDVLTYNGTYNGKPYRSLDAVEDAALIERIAQHVRQLSDPAANHLQWPLNYVSNVN